jgi:hypothetical protein
MPVGVIARFLPIVVGAFVVAMLSLACGTDSERPPLRPSDPRPACSASDLSPDLPPQDLPPAVASMRGRIARAAVACDFGELERLALDGPSRFSFSFGDPQDGPAAYWSDLEGRAEHPPLAMLVRVLGAPPRAMPPIERGGEPLWVWPSAFAKDEPTDEDWSGVEGVYSPEVVARMKQDSVRSGIGYLGYRVGITESGDWMYFIAGD